jgi:pyridoxamine 5'-phosphate oxidase family protein
LAIDDVLPPWRPRCVMVRGTAEALDQATSADGEPLGPTIRIHPAEVLSWGLDAHPA